MRGERDPEDDRADGTDLLAAVERVARAGPKLSVTSDLTVTVDGVDLAVSSFTDLVRVEVPTLRAAVTLARRERRQVAAVVRVLAAADLTAEFVVDGERVVVAGADVAPGPLARLFGFGPARVDAGGVAGVLFRALVD